MSEPKKPRKRPDGGITKTPPKSWYLPFSITVDEGTVFVRRRVWGGNTYEVLPMGVHFNLPGLFHDLVATVSLVPFQLDVGPFEITVKDMIQVEFDVKITCAVGDVAWNWVEVDVAWARAQGVWLDELAEYDRLPAAEQNGIVRVHHPTDPIRRERYEQTDASIIRAAVNAREIQDEVETSLRSALNEAAMLLGITNVESTDVADWLTRQPQPAQPGRLPIARRGATNRIELMEQATVMAAESLEPFGLVLTDLRIQGVFLPEEIAEAQKRRKVAGLERAGGADRAAAIRAGFDAVDGSRLTGMAHGLTATEALRTQARREGVEVPPLIDIRIGSGNSASPGGGDGNKGPGGKNPGGRGAPKKKR